MQSAEIGFIPPQGEQANGSRLRWNSLSLIGTLGQPDYASFVLVVVWFASIGLCVWWGIAAGGLEWNTWKFNLLGLPLALQFLYLPWVICILLVMWLGLEWAVIPAYLATLFNTLHTGVPVSIALVNALHYPLGLTAYFLFFSALSDGYALRSRRSWCAFLIASFVAVMVSSIGAFISGFAVVTNGTQMIIRWLDWWPSNFLQSLVIVAPLIFFISPVVEHAKQRYFPYARTEPLGHQRLLQFISMFALTMALLILMDDHWQGERAIAILNMPLSETVRTQIITQLAVQRVVVWALTILLVTFSLGGFIVTTWHLRRLRRLADAEMHAAREELQRSEARFRHFFDNNPAPMWVYDPENGRFLEVNLAAKNRYGYSREEFLDMTVLDIRPPEEAERLKHLKSADAAGSLWHAGEWRHRRKDGSLMDVEMYVSSMKMDGRIVHLGLAHDISPRKQAQTVIEQRARELHVLAAASLEIASAKNTEWVLQISADRARQLIGANLAVIHSWKLTSQRVDWRASLAPQYARWVDFKTSPDGSGIYKLVAQKLRPMRLTADELQKHPQFRGFGAYKEAHPPLNGLLMVPLTTEGVATGALMVSDKIEGEFDAQDEVLLTQLAQIARVGLDNLRLSDALRRHMHDLEQRVAERTVELDTSNRELDAFAYSVAHDLRAPLRAMHGFADAVLEDFGPRLGEDGRGYLERIVKASQNMDALIHDLLIYSRIGRTHMVLESVPLDDVIQDVLTELAPEIEMRHAIVHIEVPAMMVQAHRGTLKQVVLNLLSNAIKFVAPGKTPEVHIRAEVRDSRVTLSVSDNGIGIAPEHRERIFNVFERLHGAETYPGTGIGLSIVKKGLARMRGGISVESGSGGSVFQASLRESGHE